MKANFKLSRELPKIIEKYKVLSPIELHRYLLQDCNKDVDVHAISMYLKRHETEKTQYEAVFSGEAVAKVEVGADLFQNGNFKEVPSVKKWIVEKKPLVSAGYLRNNVSYLKNICLGVYYTKDGACKLEKHEIPNWVPKHPDRITLEQFLEYLGHVQDSGNWTNGIRMAFRDFWLSRTHQVLLPSEVSGMVSSAPVGADEHKIGRWKNVHVPKETIYAIFSYMKERYFLGYAAAFTGYKTGSRHQAVLTQYLKSKVYYDDGTPVIEITDKGFHRAGRLSFPKMLSPDLYAVLEECWKTNNNAFAELDDKRMMDLLKEAYRIYLKDDFNADGTVKEYSALELALAHPFHNLRHWFGRAMLEATNYNYSLVAPLGNWNSEAMLHKVYGEQPKALLKKAGLSALPQI